MSFLAKTIDRLQHLALGESLFANALHEYVQREGELVWDDDRALFWVKHPKDGWQAAVWMMPVAQQFEPRGK